MNLLMPTAIPSLKRAEYSATFRRQCGWEPSRMLSREAPPESEIAEFGGIDVDEAFKSRIAVEAD